ncbi:MAG TPA: response regulator transcription factor [Flavobacterium sp.]|uniref:response regulator transcription factor n=1 Tax=Flavobacterium sp. TaxID=239 RepID=UPI002C61F366|nr:response regulator transcription factor [Flavobacterium sp.]HNP31729.1 response regulator transcription factor [Flavobacterium sp.]
MKHILIVEDEEGIVQFLKQGLEEENYRVSAANNGADGFEFFKKDKFDLVLLDWMLPKMTGIEVCQSIREINTKIPIIFLTARDTVQETVEGLKAGANDYIKKPFSFDELVERIKVQLRDFNEQDILILGTIEINVPRFSVKVDNREVTLTQKEFDLLCYLVRNKGDICSRAQIIKDVWNIHFEYETGVIDVFMNSLRKKLNLKVDQDYIRTIRGVGYVAKD